MVDLDGCEVLERIALVAPSGRQDSTHLRSVGARLGVHAAKLPDARPPKTCHPDVVRTIYCFRPGEGPWRELVHHSGRVLQALTFAPTGAIVAAPTCGLPEEIGGVRNWDYRYTWVRDAAFTNYAFLRLGLTSEAEQFMAWLEQRAVEGARSDPLQTMYRIDGGHELPEEIGGDPAAQAGPVGRGVAGHRNVDA